MDCSATPSPTGTGRDAATAAATAPLMNCRLVVMGQQREIVSHQLIKYGLSSSRILSERQEHFDHFNLFGLDKGKL